MARKQERTRPQQEIDVTLDELHMVMDWISDHQDDAIWHEMAASLHGRLLSVWLYWSGRTNDPGTFTLRLRR